MRVTRATVLAHQPLAVPGLSPAAVQPMRAGMWQACVLALLQMLALNKTNCKANSRVKETFFSLRAGRSCRSRLFLFQHLQQDSCRKTDFFKKVLKYCLYEGS